MLGSTEFRNLVSGRRRGIGAGVTRGLLRVAEVPYTIAVGARNWRYDSGHAEVHRVDVPVVSVGNLTLGGTGKTPMVKWLARQMQALGLHVAIVSRGYGSTNGQHNDEFLELAAALPGVAHVQNRDRVAAAKTAIQEYQPQLLLLDDGFQHRRLARDLDIVLLDALEPFGFEHVFPRGTLREPLTGLGRTNAVCLSRADAISATQREDIRRRVNDIAPQAVWCELAHTASSLINSRGDRQPLDVLRNRRIAAFCGIGNPAGFRHTLSATGCELVAWREFPDHYAYTTLDQNALSSSATESNAELIVCTQKDLVKLSQPQLGGLPLWAVGIEIEFLSGREALEQLLKAVVEKL